MIFTELTPDTNPEYFKGKTKVIDYLNEPYSFNPDYIPSFRGGDKNHDLASRLFKNEQGTLYVVYCTVSHSMVNGNNFKVSVVKQTDEGFVLWGEFLGWRRGLSSLASASSVHSSGYLENIDRVAEVRPLAELVWEVALGELGKAE